MASIISPSLLTVDRLKVITMQRQESGQKSTLSVKYRNTNERIVSALINHDMNSSKSASHRACHATTQKRPWSTIKQRIGVTFIRVLIIRDKINQQNSFASETRGHCQVQEVQVGTVCTCIFPHMSNKKRERPYACYTKYVGRCTF